MVLNYNALKRGDLETVRTDIEMVERATHKHSALLKLILETSELTSGQIIQACTIANECKTGPVDFVKTSTGFGAYGARAEDLRLIRRHFNGGVKISGGVNSNNVYELLRAAADYRGGGIDLNPRFIRIGESSLLDQLSQNA